MKKSLLFAAALFVGANAWAGDKTVVGYSFDDAQSPSLTAPSNGRTTLDYSYTSVITNTVFLNAFDNANNTNGETAIALTEEDLSGESWTLDFYWSGVVGGNKRAGNSVLYAGSTALYTITDNANYEGKMFLTYGESGSAEITLPNVNKNVRFSNKVATLYNTTDYWYHFVVKGDAQGVKLTITNANSGEAVVSDVVLSAANVTPTKLGIKPGSIGGFALDELKLSYYVEGEVIQTPIAAITKVDGLKRVVTATCATEGVVLYNSEDGENFAEGAEVTVDESKTIYFKAVKGQSESDVLAFAVEAGTEITLNTPYINRTSDTNVTITADQSSVLLAPVPTIYWVYRDADGNDLRNGNFIGSGELTVEEDGSISAYAVYEGYVQSEATRQVALFPYSSVVAKFTPNTRTAGAFSEETVTVSERTYAQYIVEEQPISENILLQTEGWGIRTGGRWYTISADPVYILLQNRKAGDVIVANFSAGAVDMVNAEYAEKYTYGSYFAYIVTEDGDVELGFKQVASSVNNYFDGIAVYASSYGIVGDLTGGWDKDLVMTQDADNANIYTATVEGFKAKKGNYEYKLRANGRWGGYELPANGNNTWSCDKDGFYTLTFTADVENHSLSISAERTGDLTYTATFVNGDGWANVYAYTWTTGGSDQNAEWPGVQLEKSGTKTIDGEEFDVYTFSVTAEAAPANIIFNTYSTEDPDACKQTNDLVFVDGGEYIYKDGTVTGMETVKTVKLQNNAIYNLAGQRVQNVQKGLYIVNGKKVVKK